MNSAALEPIAMLSLGMHTSPGVYALLLGSGVSTGAGVPTGWGVVRALVRKAAIAAAPDDVTAADTAAADPEGWWATHGDGSPLGYSGLLATLAPTSAARQGLLAEFFEATEEEASEGLKVPSAAHRQVAELMRRGTVRVVLTTNFDRLLERALEDADVSPQVVSSAAGVGGMTPLQHSAATIIKLHGDYTALELRNTIDELSAYPEALNRLLDQVLDQFGLLVVGWSGDWDVGLVAALEKVSSRRYPLYWDARSSHGEAAGRLLAQQDGRRIVLKDADELFTSLNSRLEALTRLSEAPLSTDLAIARLKRLLLDPTRRIELSDLVMDASTRLDEFLARLPQNLPGLPLSEFQSLMAQTMEATRPLIALTVTGVQHDRDREHVDLWVEVLQRLLGAARAPTGAFQGALVRLRHYPALLTLRAMGIAAVHLGRDDVLLRLLAAPTWRDPFGDQNRKPAFMALNEYRVLDHDIIKALPRWNETRWLWPVSHLLREELRDPLRSLLPDDEDYTWAVDRYEFRVALAQRQLHVPSGYRDSFVTGEFIGEQRWSWDGESTHLLTDVDFRATAASSDSSWPWWPLLAGDGGSDTLDAFIGELQSRTRDG